MEFYHLDVAYFIKQCKVKTLFLPCVCSCQTQDVLQTRHPD